MKTVVALLLTAALLGVVLLAKPHTDCSDGKGMVSCEHLKKEEIRDIAIDPVPQTPIKRGPLKGFDPVKRGDTYVGTIPAASSPIAVTLQPASVPR